MNAYLLLLGYKGSLDHDRALGAGRKGAKGREVLAEIRDVPLSVPGRQAFAARRRR